MARLGWRSRIASGDTVGPGRSVLLLLYCDLDGAKDVSNFAVELGKLEIDHAPPRMKNDIDRGAQRLQVSTNSLSHAPLDTVAIDRLPHYFADGKPNPRTFGVYIAQWRAVRPELRPQN